MPNTLIFIGGPSQTGKSTVARALSEELGFEHVQLDSEARMAEIKQQPKSLEKRQIKKDHGRHLLETMKINAVLEGSQLWPFDINQILGIEANLISVFCGYPNASAQVKLDQIEAAEFLNANHLRVASHEKQIEKIEKYISNSQKMQQSCEQYGIPFFDFSDLTNLDGVQGELRSYLLTRVAELGN